MPECLKPNIGGLKFEYDSVFKIAKDFDSKYSKKKENIEKDIVRLFSSIIENVDSNDMTVSSACCFISKFIAFDFLNDRLRSIIILAGELQLPNLVKNAPRKWEELKNRIKQLKQDLFNY